MASAYLQMPVMLLGKRITGIFTVFFIASTTSSKWEVEVRVDPPTMIAAVLQDSTSRAILDADWGVTFSGSMREMWIASYC